MTPQDTVIHLRQMRTELQARVSASQATAKRRQGLHKDYREVLLIRIAALSSAIAMIELGTWVDPKDVIIQRELTLR